jgi:hypothetical protein
VNTGAPGDRPRRRWAGTATASACLALMATASVWAWPSLSVGVAAPQRDGSVVAVSGWPFAVLMPVLLAQALRRRAARATGLPPWRDDTTHAWSASMTLVALSFTFLGLHAVVLSLATHSGVRLALSALGVCLGVVIVVLGSRVGTIPTLTHEQRQWFPAHTRSLVDAYRAGFQRSAERLRWPLIVLGVLTASVAVPAPWLALFVPAVAALTLSVPVVAGLMAALDRRRRDRAA